MRNYYRSVYIKNIDLIRDVYFMFRSESSMKCLKILASEFISKEDLFLETYEDINYDIMDLYSKEFTVKDAYFCIREYAKLGLLLSNNINIQTVTEFWQPSNPHTIGSHEIYDIMLMLFLVYYYTIIKKCTMTPTQVRRDLSDIIHRLNYMEFDRYED